MFKPLLHQEEKTSSVTSQKQLLLVFNQNGKAIYKLYEIHTFTVRRIVYEWRAFRTIGSLPSEWVSHHIRPRSGQMLKDIKKTPRTTSSGL